eukprot:111818_1
MRKFSKRESFHTNKSATVGFTAKQRQSLKQIIGSKSLFEDEVDDGEESCDSDFDDNEYRNMSNMTNKKIVLPPLQKPDSSGKYTFRIKINSKKKDEQNKKLKHGKNTNYSLQLPGQSSAVPVQLKQSYSLSPSASNLSISNCGHIGPNLSLAVSDSEYEYDSDEDSTHSMIHKDDDDDDLISHSSDISHMYGFDDDEDHKKKKKKHLTRGLVDSREWELNLLPDTPFGDDDICRSPSFNIPKSFFSVTPKAKKHSFHPLHPPSAPPIHDHAAKSMSSTNLNKFDVEEFVIDYHIPSISKSSQNQNIKLYININNDVQKNKNKKSSKSNKNENKNKNKNDNKTTIKTDKNKNKHNKNAYSYAQFNPQQLQTIYNAHPSQKKKKKKHKS